MPFPSSNWHHVCADLPTGRELELKVAVARGWTVQHRPIVSTCASLFTMPVCRQYDLFKERLEQALRNPGQFQQE